MLVIHGEINFTLYLCISSAEDRKEPKNHSKNSSRNTGKIHVINSSVLIYYKCVYII